MPRAAVLIPLYEKDGELHVLFTVRTELVEHHKGQISFPGGAADETDADLRETALRETYEEVGVRPEHVEVFGRLDDFITVSNFVVAPYVGSITVPAPYPFDKNELEVAAILEVPLAHLLDRANVESEVRRIQGRDVLTYMFRFNRHVIWGATARILKQFLDLIVREEA